MAQQTKSQEAEQVNSFIFALAQNHIALNNGLRFKKMMTSAFNSAGMPERAEFYQNYSLCQKVLLNNKVDYDEADALQFLIEYEQASEQAPYKGQELKFIFKFYNMYLEALKKNKDV